MSATKADTGSSNLIIEMGLMFLYMHLGMVLYEVSIKSEHFLVTIFFFFEIFYHLIVFFS